MLQLALATHYVNTTTFTGAAGICVVIYRISVTVFIAFDIFCKQIIFQTVEGISKFLES